MKFLHIQVPYTGNELLYDDLDEIFEWTKTINQSLPENITAIITPFSDVSLTQSTDVNNEKTSKQ